MVPRAFGCFFELNREAAALMEHSDGYMRGRMFASVLELLMPDAHLGPGGYLAWELKNNIKAYSATTAKHESLFQSMREVLDNDLGSKWRSEWQQSWASRIAPITQQVTQL